MKSFIGASIIAISGLASATLMLVDNAPEYTLGKQYTISWTQDMPYVNSIDLNWHRANCLQILELHLVKETDYGWDDVLTVWNDTVAVGPTGTFVWRPDDSYPTGK